MQVHKARDVFGISRDIPLNYIERRLVDSTFVDNLTRDKHIVVYGSSKQGKTCLRKHCLQDDDYITVTCLNKWDLGELHSSILKAVGYRTQQAMTKTVSGKHMLGAKLSTKAQIPFLVEGRGEGQYQHEKTSTEELTEVNLELDPYDVNDIIRALRASYFSMLIVLEDFHYLPFETQKDFSFALKAFHANSEYCFIIVGVWREENRLITFNGDLTNRVISVDVDRWSSEELLDAIRMGENLLNIQFKEDFKERLLEGAFSSIHLFQEACLRCCSLAGISETQTQLRVIGEDLNASDLVRQVVDEQKSRYTGFLIKFSEGSSYRA